MLLFMPAPSWAGESWPQFRGPDGQGHADAVGLPVTWSDDENVTWKTAIAGRGWSSPVVDGDRIWLTTALDDGRSLHALCIDRASGRIVHDEHVFNIDEPAKINAKNSYASPTPVIEGDRVWVHFGTYGTACLDSRSGKILWTNNELKLDHKEGPGSSPILVGNLLVVNCDGMDVQYVVALDKRTGSIVWKAERSGRKNADPDLRKAYSTPLAIDVAGRKQIVSVGADRASAYDAATGAELWYVDFEGFSNVPRPLFAGGLVILDTGYMKPQLWAIRPDGAGDVTESHIVWRVKN
jgi:outer membrane protein assembly factor BamB